MLYGNMCLFLGFVLGCLSLNGKFWFEYGGPLCNLKTQEDADFLADSIMKTLTNLEGGLQKIY